VPAPLPADPGAHAQAVADALLSGERKAVLLGNAAAAHPQAAALLSVAQFIGQHTGASVGYLGDAGNAVGAQLVGALPSPVGLNAGQMLSQPMKALLLLNTEPVLDAADAAAARAALSASGLVVALTPFKDSAAEFADVLLPIAPFTETGGSFVNAEGLVQTFHGVVKPLGDARPGWKVLRVLGNLLGLPGFDFETVEAVRAEALGDLSTLASRLDNGTTATPSFAATPSGLQRISDVPIYATDMLVRRAPSLQLTGDARELVVGLPPALFAQVGERVRITQGSASTVLAARADATLAENTVRIAAGHAATSALGALFGTVTVERA